MRKVLNPSKSLDLSHLAESGRRAGQTLSDRPEQTVGAHLQARYGGEYSAIWLAGRLRCSQETATELASYWMPRAPSPQIERSLGVFANALNLDLNRLVALLVPSFSESKPEMRRPAPASVKVLPAPLQQTVPVESIGSAAGLRVAKQRKPTIVWRKARKIVEPT